MTYSNDIAFNHRIIINSDANMDILNISIIKPIVKRKNYWVNTKNIYQKVAEGQKT
jgi:hypothetical protein